MLSICLTKRYCLHNIFSTSWVLLTVWWPSLFGVDEVTWKHLLICYCFFDRQHLSKRRGTKQMEWSGCCWKCCNFVRFVKFALFHVRCGAVKNYAFLWLFWSKGMYIIQPFTEHFRGVFSRPTLNFEGSTRSNLFINFYLLVVCFVNHTWIFLSHKTS